MSDMRTQTPRLLDTKLGEAVTMSCFYDPDILPNIPDEPQDITIWYTELFFLGSPNCRIELVKGKDQFKGYLSGFKPNGMVEGEPAATCEIRIVP